MSKLEDKKLLSDIEVCELKNRHRLLRDKGDSDRIKSLLMRNEGYSYAEISRILLLDDETIRRYVFSYLDSKKLSKSNKGKQSNLSDEEQTELFTHLEEKTYLYVKEICEYVKNKYKKIYSISGMRAILQKNGFRYKKPHEVPAKLDEEAQQEFIRKYNELKKEASLKEEEIYFIDSSHPQHKTRLTYGWIKKGVRKAVKMNAKQYRVNLIGAISLNNHNVVCQESDKINTDTIKEFLNKIRNNHLDNKTIHIILDNAGYHKSKEVVKHSEELNIKIHYLPPYSPNLNPIERLWKIMHENVTYNRFYKTFKDFKSSINNFFDNISENIDILKSRINDNFQIISNLNLAI